MICDRCPQPLTFAESVECVDQIGDVHHDLCCQACLDAAAEDAHVDAARGEVT